MCYPYSILMKYLSNPTKLHSVLTHLGGTARTRDILAAGVHPRDLYAARDANQITEVTRGVFRLGTDPMVEPDLVPVAMRMPKALFCLITALHIHDLTEEIPRKVFIALPAGVHSARLDHPPLWVFHYSKESYEAGVEHRIIDGVSMAFTTPAKSVADAFKFRNKIGLSVALDALKQALRSRKCTPAQLDEMARICRVQRVMRPYIEALV